MTIRKACLALAVLLSMWVAGSATAQEPGWSMAVSPMSAEAQEIRQQPILDRPYRPGHVYGNTVRRMHYRGHPLPVPVYRQHGGFRR